MSAIVILVGTFGVVAGWHWKHMHQSWRNLRSGAEQARGKLPGLRAARSHQTWRAFWLAVAAVLIITFIMKLHLRLEI
jgi:hypothetical protein